MTRYELEDRLRRAAGWVETLEQRRVAGAPDPDLAVAIAAELRVLARVVADGMVRE